MFLLIYHYSKSALRVTRAMAVAVFCANYQGGALTGYMCVMVRQTVSQTH